MFFKVSSIDVCWNFSQILTLYSIQAYLQRFSWTRKLAHGLVYGFGKCLLWRYFFRNLFETYSWNSSRNYSEIFEASSTEVPVVLLNFIENLLDIPPKLSKHYSEKKTLWTGFLESFNYFPVKITNFQNMFYGLEVSAINANIFLSQSNSSWWWINKVNSLFCW